MVTTYLPSELYQPGDFIRDRDGTAIAYSGPVYNIKYPDSMSNRPNDRIGKIITWMILGFEGVREEMKYGTDWTVRIWGDIPKNLKDNLQESGIEIKLTKERGELSSLDYKLFKDPGI